MIKRYICNIYIFLVKYERKLPEVPMLRRPILIVSIALLLIHAASAGTLTLPVAERSHAPVCMSLVGPFSSRVELTEMFRENFTLPPLETGRWVPHFFGTSKVPLELYVRGKNSDIKRKLAVNGEQQLYVDPSYWGLAPKPLGLNPFSIENGHLTIRAERTPEELKPLLPSGEYLSGILSSHKLFSQKYGYFEIEAKVPFGRAVWPAFWLLQIGGAWPPEIDVFEGQGTYNGILAVGLHWRGFDGRHSCVSHILVPDAAEAFHRYGVLWEQERVTWYLDRHPFFSAPASIGLDGPMYMLVNLAIGTTKLSNVGQVDETTPKSVDLAVRSITVYKIDK